MHKTNLKLLVKEKPMKIEILEKHVLAEMMLILFKLCSCMRQIHDYKHSLKTNLGGEATARS